MTLLNHVVNSSIYNHPSIFRDVDYNKSRLNVLNFLFLGSGNGYEWSKDGCLYCPNLKPRKTLPKNFFDKKLFDLEINSGLKKEIKKNSKTDFVL